MQNCPLGQFFYAYWHCWELKKRFNFVACTCTLFCAEFLAILGLCALAIAGVYKPLAHHQERGFRFEGSSKSDHAVAFCACRVYGKPRNGCGAIRAIATLSTVTSASHFHK